MNDNLYETQYDVTKKTKIRIFYDNNKFIIYSTVAFFIIAFVSVAFYFNKVEKKKLELSNKYIKSIIYIDNNKKDKALINLKEIILENNPTYSALSLFLILNQNLIKNQNEVIGLFDHVLNNNDFENEIKNLVIFKKALFQSDFVNEKVLINALNPLLNTESLWKPHALLLVGDYFFSKQEYLKAREFYIKIMELKNLHNEMYDHAQLQLTLIPND
jgi:hypothetical protein